MASAHVLQAVQHSGLDTLGVMDIRDIQKKRQRVLPPGPMSRSSYVDDSICLFCE
jgi:hypothetical protein